MRPMLAALVLAFPLSAAAQHDQAESNWARVQGLPPKTAISVKIAGHKTRCNFVSATLDVLTCARGDKAPETFDRTAVTLVQRNHRTKSTVIGLGVGAAGGAIFGAAIGKTGGLFGKGELAGAFLLPGAVVGGIIGAAGNFAHTTLYRAP